jgi:hypothetical protein
MRLLSRLPLPNSNGHMRHAAAKVSVKPSGAGSHFRTETPRRLHHKSQNQKYRRNQQQARTGIPHDSAPTHRPLRQIKPQYQIDQSAGENINVP